MLALLDLKLCGESWCGGEVREGERVQGKTGSEPQSSVAIFAFYVLRLAQQSIFCCLSMMGESLRYRDVVYSGRQCCCQVIRLVEDLIQNTLFVEAIEDLRQGRRDEFKAESNEGCVWIQGRPTDLGNICYCTLWQLVWYVCKNPNSSRETLAAMEELAERYPCLSDKWPVSSGSIELKADVLEYVLAKARFTGPAVERSRVRSALACNALFRGWYEQWQRILRILRTNEDQNYSHVVRKLTSPRNLAQLIGLAAVAERLEQNPESKRRLQLAIDHYSHS